MLWNKVIRLGNLEETIVKGEPVQSYVWRDVFANKRSVKQSEFYQAASVGLKPEIVLEVKSIDFNNDEKVQYNNKEYFIIRSYDKGEVTELTVTSHVGSEV